MNKEEKSSIKLFDVIETDSGDRLLVVSLKDESDDVHAINLSLAKPEDWAFWNNDIFIFEIIRVVPIEKLTRTQATKRRKLLAYFKDLFSNIKKD